MKLRCASLTFALVAACHSGGPGAQPGLVAARLGSAELLVVAGVVVDPAGRGIPGVVVTGPPAEPRGRVGANGAPVGAVTDATGRFLVVGPSTGSHAWTFDGTGVAGPARYPAMTVQILTAPGLRTLPSPVVLPDLAGAGADEALVAVAGGVATGEALLVAGDLSLHVAPGTAVTRGGAPVADPSLTVAIAPLAPAHLPARLPEGLHPLSAAFVSPDDVAFGPSLDLALPSAGLTPGTTVEVWAYGDEGWAPAGTGRVSVDGRRIEAPGVVEGSGAYAAVAAVEPTCATTVAGSVVLQGGEPVAGALVTLSTGQGAVTDAAGMFFVSSVPAYDPASLPACVPVGFAIDVLPPAAIGGGTVRVDVVSPGAGGLTDAGAIVLNAAPGQGILAGRVADAAGGVAGDALLEGPSGGPLPLDGNGAFTLSGVVPGSYTVSFVFPGETAARRATVEVSAGGVAALVLERLRGAGTRTIEVQVLQMDSILLGGGSAPVSGAVVTLIGTDTLSATGLVGTSNADGVVVFEQVDGPFSVTAQKDVLEDFERVRRGATVLDIDPPDGRIGVPVDGNGFAPMSPTDAFLTGTVANLPPDYGDFPNSADQILLYTSAVLLDGTRVPGFGIVDPTGAFVIPVPSGVPIEIVLDWENGLTGVVGALVRSLGPVPPGGAATSDFDLQGPEFIPFDRPQQVTIENLVPMSFPLLSISARTEAGTSLVFGAPRVVAFSGTETVTIHVPDFSQPGSPFLDPKIGISEGGLALLDYMDLPVDGSPVTFTVLASPTPASPASGQYTAEAARVFDVSFDLDPARPGPGPNLVTFDGYVSYFDPAAALHRLRWSIYSAPDHTAYRLPPVAVPMFLPGLEAGMQVCTLSRTSAPFDYDAFFGGGLQTNLEAFRSGLRCAMAYVLIQ